MTEKAKPARRPRARARTASPAQKPGAPLLEWIAGGTGLLFLGLLLSVIGYDALAGPSQEPPAIELKQGAVTRVSNGYVVAFEAMNRGDGTAAALEIEAELMEGATVVETSSASIDYVPGHGAAEGGFFFSQDPRRLTLKMRPLGFQTP